MLYVQCDGCGKRLPGEPGTTIIVVRIGAHGDARGHACSQECIPAAANVLLKQALEQVAHPRDK